MMDGGLSFINGSFEKRSLAWHARGWRVYPRAKNTHFSLVNRVCNRDVLHLSQRQYDIATTTRPRGAKVCAPLRRDNQLEVE
eukprot:scaffold8369_cov121-Cylindrotheca_fusiformis.AAC.4